MQRSKILILLCVFLICNILHAKLNQARALSNEQVQKLAAAAWKERPHNIDVTFYEELTTPPKPIEQIRQKAEEDFEKDIAALGENPHPVLIERSRESMERNIQWKVKRQQFPRLIKKRIRISGHNQRVDQVIAEPGDVLDPNAAFDGTYVNVGERDSNDFFSFNYEHRVKHAFIDDKSGWVRRDLAQFAYLPEGISWHLKNTIGIKEGENINATFVPDPNKMQQFSRTGILADIFRLTIVPDPNATNARDQIEMRDPNWISGGLVLICDRDDYSRVYHFKYYAPGANNPLYVRECGNFDSCGFPHNITEIQYDKNGNFTEKSVYRIEEVELNPVIPDEVFKFNPPKGYKVTDIRSKKP